MYNKNSLFTGALLMLAATQAKIVTDSPLWEKDWYDTKTKMGVKNGEPFSKDEAVQRFIKAPRTIEGDVEDYREFENVKRVMRVFSKDDFEYIFPIIRTLYDYEGFLHAVGKYPAFCG